MHYSVVKPEGLDMCELDRWREICGRRSALSSPYFRPEFTLAVARHRDDVRVTVVRCEAGGEIVAFFPHQRSLLGTGKPVGGPLSDFHAVIAANDRHVDVIGILNASRLTGWRFDHLPAWQTAFTPFSTSAVVSPQMDLSGGYDAYVAGRRVAGSEYIKKTEALARKAEREIGPLRFEAVTRDPVVLERLIAWKRKQYLSARSADVFSVPWTIGLARDLLATNEPGFGGLLSAVWFGDRLAAAHLGMRSESVIHYWFPAYDEELAKFSPGIILLLRLAAWGSDHGIRTIDLGKGDSQYKLRLASGTIDVMEGWAERRSIATSLRRLRRTVESAASRGGAIGAGLSLPMKILRRIEFARKLH